MVLANSKEKKDAIKCSSKMEYRPDKTEDKYDDLIQRYKHTA